MIYFQICIFEPLETTIDFLHKSQGKLWFTFKFVSLNHWKQQIADLDNAELSCDLLSNLYLWTIGNNSIRMKKYRRWVVIYFQICIFEPLETTYVSNGADIAKLWFTFKFVSLNHWKQPPYICLPFQLRCDLLSNLYLWTIGNNKCRVFGYGTNVVIYFQICIFEPLETTQRELIKWLFQLWFTFKFVSLNHWKQLWQYNCWWFNVVIYFQICIFEPLETTRVLRLFPFYKLWFTFKFVSLNHWKQLLFTSFTTFASCDLLSNLYLWTIGNNTIKSSKSDL